MKYMEKKTRWVLTVAAVLYLWGAIVMIDGHRCGNLKQPLFALPMDGGMYRGIGYQVEVELEESEPVSVTMKLFGRVFSASIL